jgi:hypothetical protein
VTSQLRETGPECAKRERQRVAARAEQRTSATSRSSRLRSALTRVFYSLQTRTCENRLRIAALREIN